MKNVSMTVGFIFTHDLKQIYLLKKSHPEWQKGLFNGIGGKLESPNGITESFERGFKREAAEEAKAHIDLGKLLSG